MPDLTLEIGGRSFDVACEPGQEQSLERAARLFDGEAMRVQEAVGRATEQRMLLLAGLMLADTMTGLEDRLQANEDRIRAAEERARIAEAKSAMLAATALKLETQMSHKGPDPVLEELREENEHAAEILGRVLAEINALTEHVSA